ncbi:NAD(P)-dependent alcohol dehydrogenase [Nesterenkonia sp. E16_7]|uniref:NAD(P)-dependent alcohol dehydrogenase n=1 Tax=unclassified Nesterenkonia TaxID=2629769 RepID=UPI001A91621C|nr:MULTISPECIES: NAD(P)-dependent alcohol dehydrogenase [unclassified Nesterenkonia]MBO0595881.1 NAD(P)-dependent alcohol dehydrogenase [Nesterenkonia sp. E16_10]MBO0599520.1 NAD(P)-dependent alcohol dehydrogenase [Nesterenkonia sp. E16_7]
MKALQYVAVGQPPEVREVPTPEPGPGEVRLRITAAGACHSDSFVMGLSAEQYAGFGYPLPMTLGHEGVGVVDALGEGASGVELGEPVAVYGPQGCGRCHSCAAGIENYCPHAAALGITPPGLGKDGVMAEYMIVTDTRLLIPLGGLDPVATVALTDAGLTPYHAIMGSLELLVPGSVAVVIGVGGLGHLAIQLLRTLTSATVIALDISQTKLDFAREFGAHHAFLSDDQAAARVAEAIGAGPVTAVFDFVTTEPVLKIVRSLSGPGTDLVLVGAGAVETTVGLLGQPFGSRIRAPYWGSRPELMEVLELARTGRLSVDTESFSLQQGPEAYRRLHDGELRGRAVVVP